GMETNPAEAPIFTGANFSFARVQGHFAGFDFRGANFFHADLAADMRNQSMGLIRADFSGALLDHANFAEADLGRALFRFAKLRGADLRGAKLLRADFTGADLTGADFTGADTTEADFSQAVLKDTKGLPETSGKMP
ncbi:MAG: pentapeptide repeat-containing protein, partial [Acetobacteraceae bacterium]|nr:pentapeptide repeat-containing protein [Acetobacteraceae bacterium]